MDINTTYFKETSSAHTEKVFSIVTNFLETNDDIEHVVVATTEGTTGLLAANTFKNKRVVVVTHQTGFVIPNENELDEEVRAKILSEGALVFTATHAFAGVPRGIRRELGTWQTTEIIAVAYRTFGQGTKVCAEIAMMAADAGLVPVDKDVICIAGTGRGADTAWIVQPANTHAFPKIKMRACLCKPMEF
ncbi:hypothetical protein EU527_01170 [Candidatus Thorarchaeota archaeon]|nr:MAG: hypothetical protein EU527_01170 [Candidatus Thorarchaeota archaeon]